MKHSILLTGSIAYDRIMNFPGYFKNEIMPDKIHSLSVSFFVEKLEESFGGTAGNIAYNLALLNENPLLLGNVGAKDFAAYKKWLTKHRIKTTHVKNIKDQLTASAYIITDKNDNQISGFFPGAMFVPASKGSAIPKASIAMVSPQNPVDMVAFPKIFKKKKIKYIFDPGQQVTSLSGAQLQAAITGAEILIGNDYEISLISKKTGWNMKKLLGKARVVVTTFGHKGSELRSGSEVYKVKAVKVKKIVDPTGAGDAYRAGFVSGLERGFDLKKSGQLGSVVAAYAVEKSGTQNHKFTWTSVKKRYRQNYKQTI